MLLTLMAVWGCTPYVDLCMEEHPHRAQLRVNYTWAPAMKAPERMALLMLREVNRMKLASVWDTEKEVVEKGYPLFTYEDDKCQEIPFSHEEGEVPEPIYALSGDYSYIAVPWNEENKEACKIYLEDLASDGTGLYIQEHIEEEIPLRFFHFPDYNSYSGFFNSEAPLPILISNARISVPENVNKDYKIDVPIAPKSVSQTVELSLKVKSVDPTLTVDSVICQLSGVISGVNIFSGELDITRTHKTIFLTSDSLKEDGSCLCSATIYVPGLVRSAKKTNLTGPGILNASVYTSYLDEKERPRQHRFDATINLHRYLSDNPSVKYIEEDKIVQTALSLRYDIESTLVFSREGLVSEPGALDQWIPSKDISYEESNEESQE